MKAAGEKGGTPASAVCEAELPPHLEATAFTWAELAGPPTFATLTWVPPLDDGLSLSSDRWNGT